VRSDRAPGGLPTLSVGRVPDRRAGLGEEDGDALERALLRSLILALMAEGRRFAGTPAGRRWQNLLAESSLVREGWALWGMAGVDVFLRGADRGPGSPRAMAEDILALLGSREAPRAGGLVVALEAPPPAGDERADA